jgi:3D (Asp-Asp-Asp) domain-containing protein
MNYALIVDIITVFITIVAGILPIVSYGQYMTYSPASTQSVQSSHDKHSKFHNENQGQTNCSSDWYITGYFTPKESDYSGLKKTIFVHEVGNMSFYNSFLNDVRIEGAGETHFGWYIINHGHG